MRCIRRLGLTLALALPAAAFSWGTALAADGDGDGWDAVDDCDDADAAVHPGQAEVCDGLDTDCDVLTDELVDGDADTQAACDGDCDDRHNWLNGLDMDLDGASTCAADCDDADPLLNVLDADLDGWSTCDGDCDDALVATLPGAAESCDGLDNDCDGQVPDDEVDGDLDGVTECSGDCKPTNPEVYPGAVEACDGIDNDCDDEPGADEVDGDGDGALQCADCDDADAAINSSAAEVCDDGVDNNCDGLSDAADAACADQVPTADAGVGPQGEYFAGPVVLRFDGSASVDAEVGDVLVWRWTLVEDTAYDGVEVVAFHAAGDSPYAFLVLNVNPDKVSHAQESPNDAWDFPVQLVVNDGVQDSAPVVVTGHVFATAHFLDAGPIVTCSSAPRGSAPRLGALVLGLALALGLRRRAS